MYKLSELFANCAWNVHYKQVGDSVNYAFVEKGDTLYIYFEGSNSITDWVRNFLFPAKPYKDMEIPYRVHRGFLSAWKEVEDIIIKKIQETVVVHPGSEHEDPEASFNKNTAPVTKYKWERIVVVGYSHGGALAAFCHECVWFWRPDLREDGLVGYGFEAPRIYAAWHVKNALKERWRNFFVIRCGCDIVTHCPPVIFGFCHVGKIIKIKGDPGLVLDKVPTCVKYHYPQVVYQGLVNWEKGIV